MLSATGNLKTDKSTNALIISDRADIIKAAMSIVNELDKGGVRDAIEVLPLYYTGADFVADLFNNQQTGLLQKKTGDTKSATQMASMFPKSSKVLAIKRTNSLVIMGTVDALNTIREFIIKYIDHPLESGKSILHVYELQYLESSAFAPVLDNLLKQNPTPGTGQYMQIMQVHANLKMLL